MDISLLTIQHNLIDIFCPTVESTFFICFLAAVLFPTCIECMFCKVLQNKVQMASSMCTLIDISEPKAPTERSIGHRWDSQSLTSLGYTVVNLNTTGQPLDNMHAERNHEMLYMAMTKEEFTSWTSETGKLHALAGWARQPHIPYLILSTCPLEALSTLAWHMSDNLVSTAHMDEVYIAALSLNRRNTQEHLSRRYMSTFNRGYSLVQVQLHANAVYTFDDMELALHTMHKITAAKCATRIYDIFNWNTGHVWAYNSIVDLRTVDEADAESRIHSVTAMAMEIMGLMSLQKFTPGRQAILTRHMSSGTSGNIPVKGTKEDKQIPGHPEHSAFVQEQMQTHYLKHLADRNALYRQILNEQKGYAMVQ